MASRIWGVKICVRVLAVIRLIARPMANGRTLPVDLRPHATLALRYASEALGGKEAQGSLHQDLRDCVEALHVKHPRPVIVPVTKWARGTLPREMAHSVR